MTKKELDTILKQNAEELVFEDGYSISTWVGANYCLYTPNQHFGQGTVCDFKAAVQFYNEHKEDNTMGGRGSGSGRASGGGGAAKQPPMRTLNDIENEIINMRYSTSRGVSRLEYEDGNTYVEVAIKKTSDGYRADVYSDDGQHYYKTFSTQAKAKGWANSNVADIAYEAERQTYEMNSKRRR